MQIKDIKFDERNYRIHSEKNKQLIRKSINECGLARSVVVDNENCLIGGNGVVSQLDKNTPVKIIETDGSELVVVKRTDLSTDDEKRRQLAVMDNSTSDSSEFDYDLLKADFAIDNLLDFGIDIPTEVDEKLKNELDNKFSANLGTVIYEPKETNHKPEDFYKIDETIFDEIDALNSSDELKKFLKLRACWLAELSFDKIADYYAYQATPEEQVIFEKLALVLLDRDKLIENGYSDLLKDIDDDCR